MKAIKIIIHPLTVIISFLFILIIGEHVGGFYIKYILLALPHGSIHAVLAVGGIVLILFSHYKYRQQYADSIEPMLNISGVCMLAVSLLLFFTNDKQQYNIGTFDQTVPVLTIIIFGLLATCFSLNSLITITKRLFGTRHQTGLK